MRHHHQQKKTYFKRCEAQKPQKIHRIYVNIYLILCFLNELYPIHGDSNENDGKEPISFLKKVMMTLNWIIFLKAFCLSLHRQYFGHWKFELFAVGIVYLTHI
jgi:hypothetical protein